MKSFKYFDYSEFDSPAVPGVDDDKPQYKKNGRSYLKDSGKNNMRKSTMKKFDKMREYYGKPLTVTSGYRTDAYNATLSGAVNQSAHEEGKAGDFVALTYQDKVDLIKAGIKAGFNRFGWMGSAIHVDDDEDRPANVIWGYSGSTPPYTFSQLKAMV